MNGSSTSVEYINRCPTLLDKNGRSTQRPPIPLPDQPYTRLQEPHSKYMGRGEDPRVGVYVLYGPRRDYVR